MIIILMGVSGAGKTVIGQRLAQETGWPFYDGDDFHPPSNIEKMAQGIPLTDVDRLPWLARLRQLIEAHIEAGQPAIMACSALKQSYRHLLAREGEEVQFVYLKGAYELIHQRLRARSGHFMKAELLAGQFAALEEPEDGLVVDTAVDPTAVVAQIRHKLGL